MASRTVTVSSLRFGNELPFVLVGGVNVLESRDLAFRVAEAMRRETGRLGVPYVFKASFDKANRSSIASYRGPGLEEGLALLAEVKAAFEVPVLTDVHEPAQAPPAAEVCDILQLPAFLCRQTDLVLALARTGAAINVKKGQFLAPREAGSVAAKIEEAGNRRILLCERGTSFGYHNLVVDMLGLGEMKALGHPVVLDVTHALQLPGGLGGATAGRRRQALELARAGVAAGLAGVFLEAHPEPDRARCDGPCALPLDKLGPFLDRIKAIDDLVKAQTELAIE